MLIDWFTVAAQITNFLVLVWLLKRFLYGPILKAMAQREKRTRETIESAERREAEAGRERAEFQQKNAEFDREKQSLTMQARQSADEDRARLLDAARTEIETLRSKWRESLAAEQAVFRKELTLQTQEEVVGIARQALKDLADTDLEDRMAQVFIGRIKNLTGSERQRLASAANDARAPAIVRSTAPLPPATRERIEAVVSETFGVKPPVQFETSESLVTGIELSLGGYKVAWTLGDYLAALGKTAAQLLDKDGTHEPAA